MDLCAAWADFLLTVPLQRTDLVRGQPPGLQVHLTSFSPGARRRPRPDSFSGQPQRPQRVHLQIQWPACANQGVGAGQGLGALVKRRASNETFAANLRSRSSFILSTAVQFLCYMWTTFHHRWQMLLLLIPPYSRPSSIP